MESKSVLMGDSPKQKDGREHIFFGWLVCFGFGGSSGGGEWGGAGGKLTPGTLH